MTQIGVPISAAEAQAAPLGVINTYCRLDEVKAAASLDGVSEHDLALWGYIEAASREIEDECNRHFWIEENATRYFDALDGRRLWIDDVLSIDSVAADEAHDLSYSQAWTEGTDYVLWPWDEWPKERLEAGPQGRYRFRAGRGRYVRIVGDWGYGDGMSATPYYLTGGVITVDGASTSATVTGGAALAGGDTIRVDDEQMFVRDVAENVLTVVRGINGTLAAAHTDGAVSRYQWPARIRQACTRLAIEYWNKRDLEGYTTRKIGNYSETIAGAVRQEAQLARMLGPYRKGKI
jgi:hypothetical protein